MIVLFYLSAFTQTLNNPLSFPTNRGLSAPAVTVQVGRRVYTVNGKPYDRLVV
jgi:hypothetical protein